MDNKLACLIKIIAEAELQCDYARLALCEAPGFDPSVLFKKFDKYNKGVISIDRLKELLAKHHITATEDEILEVINGYDRNQSGRLSIYEFKDMIIPKAHTVYKTHVNHGSLQDEGLLFSTVLHIEINLLRAINPLRALLQTTKSPDLYQLFRMIDKKGRTYFDHKDLQDFMLEQNLYLHHPDILAFFRRIDKTESARISYNEFKTVLLPELSKLELIANRGANSINKPHDYFSYNADKYGVGPISSPTILEPTPLIAEYKLGKDYPRTHSAQKTNTSSTRSTLKSYNPLYRSARKSESIAKPPLVSLDTSEISEEVSRYKKIYPYVTNQHFKENMSPNKVQYCPENYDSTYSSYPVRTTHDYYISEYRPYTLHPYDKNTYRPPAPVSLADRRKYVPELLRMKSVRITNL